MSRLKTHIAGCMFLVACLFSCTDMDHAYRDFWKDGELVYPAPVDSVKVFPGENRIVVEWRIMADPSVVFAKMYWNNKNDSLVFPVTSAEDVMRIEFPNMKEGTYSFTIYTFDGKGNRSVPREITAKSYGDVYKRSLVRRLTKDAYYDEVKSQMVIAWGDRVDATSIGSEITYKQAGVEQPRIFLQKAPAADTLKIADYDVASGSVTYRTAYLPAPASLDTFYSQPKTVKIKGPIRLLDRTGWTVTASSWDTRYPADNANPRTPEMIIDGSLSTAWINQISPQLNYPHWVAVDMQREAEVYGVVLSFNNRNETPQTIEVLVSIDNATWTSVQNFVTKNTTSTQYFEFDEAWQARYVKINCKRGSGGSGDPNTGTTPNVAIYEYNVYTR